MPRKIKILHLIKSLGRGGAEKLIPETALVHNKDRFEFHCLYFYHQKNNIVNELESVGIKVHLIPSSNLGLFFQVKKVGDFSRALGIDIIHAHLPWAGILSRFVGNKLKIPIVYTEHNTWDRYNKVSYWGNRMTFKQQDVAIAVSNEVALSMQLNSMIDPYKRGGRLKVKMIQNGVNTEVFRRMENGDPDSYREGEGIREQGIELSESVDQGISELVNREEVAHSSSGEISAPDSYRGSRNDSFKTFLGIPESAPVIGKVAVFRSQKRLWIWVDLALKILESCPETHFLLVGDGEWRDRILAQIEASGKSSNFHWVGVQKNVLPYLSVMDIYLSTSEFEGLPIAMLEAMSCEIPVVATRAGGIGEVVQHGVQGFLSEIEEYEELVDYCIQLIQNPEIHQKMSSAARARVVQQFSMKRMVQELEEVYESVLLV
ncbi:glycosyltransferase [Algoriphagus sp. SE2]|uniref:glycosyltransferase n=1 Tax=Algoriphagus sp. SE2 TaxID=3141536 RepID=UPI0031CD4B05